MPIYEYKCEDCGAEIEVLQKASEPPKKKCPKCGASKLKKKLSVPAIQFKGEGWYVTDHAKRSGPKPEGTKAKAAKPASEKKDAGSTKPDKD